MSHGFDGSFDLLPFRAGIDHGPVPRYPTDGDWQLASCRLQDVDPFTWAGAATVWQAEAVRERRLHAACDVSPGEEHGQAVIKRAAERLARMQKEALGLAEPRIMKVAR